jgi:DNA-binding transcriptional MerR regulator
MFRIGEFSRISGVPAKTLRFYDEIGLLKPAKVDRFTGYRYYSADQLGILTRLLAFKNLGFSLDQVRDLAGEGLTPDDLRSALTAKRQELEERVREDRARIRAIEGHLEQLESGGNPFECKFRLRTLRSILVASVRDTVHSFSEAEGLFEVLNWQVNKHGRGVGSATAWGGGHGDHSLECEVMVFLDRPIPESERVRIYQQPATTMVCALHQGDGDDSYTKAYNETRAWIDAHGFEIAGSKREVYLQAADEAAGRVEISEIQYPIISDKKI